MDIIVNNATIGTIEPSRRLGYNKREENLIRAVFVTVELFVTTTHEGVSIKDYLETITEAVAKALGMPELTKEIATRTYTAYGVCLQAKAVDPDAIYDESTGRTYRSLSLQQVGRTFYGKVSAEEGFIRFTVPKETPSSIPAV